jgi:hypothetical protein
MVPVGTQPRGFLGRSKTFLTGTVADITGSSLSRLKESRGTCTLVARGTYFCLSFEE